MTEQCDRCGIEYTPMILEKFSKNSKIAIAIELFGYVVLGGYALFCYYFFDSIWALIFCSVVALVLYRFLSPEEKGLCDTCVEETNRR